MINIENDQVTYFDVDDTLIFWKTPKEFNKTSDKISFIMNGRKVEKYVISEHVEELKRQKESGAFVIVHSNSGGKWAKEIVKALKLEEYVDITIGKPKRYYDDENCSEWMPKRRFYGKI